MCVYSMVIDWASKLPDEYWNRPRSLEAYNDLIKRAAEYDKQTGQPDCEDPAKAEFLKKLQDPTPSQANTSEVAMAERPKVIVAFDDDDIFVKMPVNDLAAHFWLGLMREVETTYGPKDGQWESYYPINKAGVILKAVGKYCAENNLELELEEENHE